MRFIPQLGLLLAVGLLCAGTLAAQNAPKLVQVGVVKDYAYTVKPIDNNGLNLILVNEHVVKFKHASYVSLDLASVTLGEGSFLEFTSILDSDMQIMPHDNIQDMTAFFNGDAVRVRLWAAPNTRGNGYRITKVSVGNPPALQPNTICGTGDDRVPSGDRGIGRVFLRRGTGTFVCTAFLINKTNCFATAGHCLDRSATRIVVQFQVPSSTSTGATRNATAANTYNWTGSRFFQNNSSGDWGVFTTKANTTTGKHAYQAQLRRFLFSATFTGTVRVTGYGKDSTPKSRNFTQQTATGSSLGFLSGNRIRYYVDTEGGDSGAPVIKTNGFVSGVHTNGGCNILPPPFSFNHGTRAMYAPFVSARTRLCNPKPDLSPTLVSSSSIIQAGSTIALSSTIKNLSSGGTGGWAPRVTSGYYLSTNSIISTTDILLKSFSTVPLGPQQIHRHSTTALVPRRLRSSSSVCFIGVFADRTRTLSETSETNNTRSLRRTCRGLPDLRATALQINTTTIRPRQRVTIQSKIKNIGQATSAAVLSGHYISSNSIISTSDRLLASFTTLASAINVERLVTTTVTLPSSLPVRNGFCFVGVFADRLSRLREILESNNTRAIRVNCRPLVRADLTPISLASSDLTVVANQVVRLTSRIQNIGTATSSSVASRYFLSTNSIISNSDTVLGSFFTPVTVVRGIRTHSMSVRIPRTVRSGRCFFGVFADYLNRLLELNEANNTRALQATCTGRPDLIVDSLTNSNTTLRAGTSIAVTSRTRNIGGATAGASTTGIFLSTNSIISTADDFLGAVNHPAIAAGGSRTVTTRHLVPFCTPRRTCWLGAIADVGRRVSELFETNNTRSLQKACINYTGSGKFIEWRPRYPNISTTLATFSARAGGSGSICITAPRFPKHLYLLVWSANPSVFTFDAFTNFSLGLLNGPVFPLWFSAVNSSGLGNAAFNLPKTAIPFGFTTYTYSLWFNPAFVFVGLGSNRIVTRINR